MQRDGLDPSIMDLDHDKSVASQLKKDEESADDGPPLKDDPAYAKVSMAEVQNGPVLVYLLSHLSQHKLIDRTSSYALPHPSISRCSKW